MAETSPNTEPVGARKALIDAAIDLFGDAGYDAVSTRMLSETAGTNLASIKYYFGSKDDLYRAALEHVVEYLKPRILFALAAFEQGSELAGDDRELQAKLVAQLVERVAGVFLGDAEVPHFMPFVLREFFTPGPHFDVLYEALPRHLHELFTRIVGMAYDLDPTSEEAIVRAHGIIGQVMIFHVGREILFRRTGWQEFTPDLIAKVTREIQHLVLRSLSLPVEVIDETA